MATPITKIYPKNLPDPLQMKISSHLIKIQRGFTVNVGKSVKDYLFGTKDKEGNEKTEGDTGNYKQIKTTQATGNVILPIPQSFNIALNHTWEDIESYYTTIKEEAKNIFTSFINKAGRIKAYMGASGRTAFTPTIPVYKETSPIELPFSWKFSPKNAIEQQAVHDIIKFFQLGSMPQGEVGTVGKEGEDPALLKVIKSPHLFSIQFIPNVSIFQSSSAQKQGIQVSRNKSMFFKNNTLKKLAITNVDVNYTPDGDYYPFQDGTPTTVELNVTFRTVDFITTFDTIFGATKSNDYGSDRWLYENLY